MILDTAFLIDLQRELGAGRNFGARDFLGRRRSEPVCISVVTWMEFAEGYDEANRGPCQTFLSSFPVAGISEEIAWMASRFARRLRAAGAVIGDHDLWIAATAVHRAEPLVTRNIRDFARLPEVVLLPY